MIKTRGRVIDAKERFGRPWASPAAKIAAGTAPILATLCAFFLSLWLNLRTAGALVVAALTSFVYLAVWVILELRRTRREWQVIMEGQLSSNTSLGQEIVAFRNMLGDVMQGRLGANLLGIPLGPGVLEVHFSYSRLRPESLAEILTSIAAIYKASYLLVRAAKWRREGQPREPDSNRTQIPDAYLDEMLKATPSDILLIDAIHTGNSITLRVKTGWTPRFSIDQGDIAVEVPSGAVSVVVATYLLVGVLNYGASTLNEVLEVLKNIKEIQKIELEIEELREAPPVIRDRIERDLGFFLASTVRNSEIQGIEVRSGSIPSPAGRSTKSVL